MVGALSPDSRSENYALTRYIVTRCNIVCYERTREECIKTRKQIRPAAIRAAFRP